MFVQIFVQRADLDEKFGSEKKRRSVHSKKRNTIENSALETAVSAARDQILNTSNGQLNESLQNHHHDNHTISLNVDEQMTMPTPNYDAQKLEEVFGLDDSLYY